MRVWEKVFKNTKSRGAAAFDKNTLTNPSLALPQRSHQLPSLFLGLAIGSTLTKRTAFCQRGDELIPWNPEGGAGKTEVSVFRAEKILSDMEREISLGEEAFSHFMSDRGDPACTLFFQPNRFLLPGTKLPSFVSTYETQKILHQSPSSKDIYQYYVKEQFNYLWKKAHDFFSEVKRFQVGHIVMEYPDSFSESDLTRFKEWVVEAAQQYFPPILNPGEEKSDLAEKFTFLPEAVTILLHWVTDQVGCKLAAPDLELKKVLVQEGVLPRITDPINFLVVTMGSTHSRVVRLKVESITALASAKRVGESVSISHNYLGRTGFGGDHISCAFLDEEEEKRFGGTPASRVSTFTRKVLSDWEKMQTPEGKRHFDELFGEAFTKAIGKLAELTVRGFGESPESTIILLGGKVFAISHFRDKFKECLASFRIPQARIIGLSEEMSIARVCEIVQFHQKGLGRSFNVRANLDTDASSRMTWRIGKVVEGTLVDTILEPDNREWDSKNPREFTVAFERGVRRLSLGYQKTVGGISQLWANINLQTRVVAPIQATFKTEGPGDLKITSVKSEGRGATVTPEEFQIDMLISGEQPSHYPLYEKLMKNA